MIVWNACLSYRLISIIIAILMQNHAKMLRSTIILGLYFLLLVTTFSSFAHIVTFMFENSPDQYPFIGKLALITNYATFLLVLTFTSGITNFKQQFLIASLCYSFSYAVFILGLTHFWGLLAAVLANIVSGYGAAVVWASQGGYMAGLLKQNNIKQEEKGKYIGILNAFVYLTVFVGSAVTTFALNFFSSKAYFIILTFIGLLGFVLCYFFIEPLETTNDYAGTKPPSDCQQRLKQISAFLTFYHLMRFIILSMILDGFILGFNTTDFSKFLPGNLKTDVDLGIMLMVHGIGAAIGGYASGTLSDKISVAKQGVICLVFIVFTCILSLIRQAVTVSGFAFPLVLGFLWGIGLYFLQGWIFVCCTKVYSGRVEAYAIAKQTHTSSFIVFQIYQTLFGSKDSIYPTLLLVLVVSLASIGVTFFYLKEEQVGASTSQNQIMHQQLQQIK